MEVVPTEQLCSLHLNTSADGRLATPGSPWVFTALVNFFFFKADKIFVEWDRKVMCFSLSW